MMNGPDKLPLRELKKVSEAAPIVSLLSVTGPDAAKAPSIYILAVTVSMVKA